MYADAHLSYICEGKTEQQKKIKIGFQSMYL